MALNPVGSDHRHGPDERNRPDLIARLRKIEGQVRGLQRMVDEDAYCIDILDQVSAVISATEKVAMKVLEEHIRGCVADAMHSDDAADAEAKLGELTQALKRFLQVGHSAVASAE